MSVKILARKIKKMENTSDDKTITIVAINGIISSIDKYNRQHINTLSLQDKISIINIVEDIKWVEKVK